MNDNLSKALSIFIEAMRPFVVGFLLEKFKDEPWEGIFFARLKPDKQNTWNKAVQSLSADSDRKQLVDYSNLSSFAIALHSSNSYPFSKISCIPRQIPRKGFL